MAANKELIWQQVADVPAKGAQFMLPNGIKRSHLIVIVKEKGLYRYDFNNNTWNKYHFIHKLQNNFDKYCHYLSVTATIDINSKTIYFLDATKAMTELVIIGNNKNQCNVDIGFGSKGIMIKGEYHLIGGSKNNKHLKYNSELNKFDVMHSFNDSDIGFAHHQIVSFNNNIFVFGGYETKHYEALDAIYHCNINENIWNKLNVKMPKSLYSFGCSTAINNKYILIFGGYDNNNNKCDEIYIFSLLNQSFIKSKVHCPGKGPFQAIAINDAIRDEMAMFGYVREQWKLSQIADHYFPPIYLLEMMHCYYLTEHIHLFHRFSNKHWKMNTFDIVP